MEIAIDDADYTDVQLPTPSDTPYRTPLLRSRQNSRIGTPSPYSARSSSPDDQHSPLPDPRLAHVAQMSFENDPISVFDPRRFTPTLHANLVAEILALRRELESKTSLIDNLENDLSAARSEHENVVETAASAQREARHVKRQLARAENDVTLEEISRERDEAVETVSELRRQLDRMSKARRSAEEDLERFRKAQERDVERWEEVRRGLERRAHVAESRLKSVLEEIAQVNEMRQIQEEEEAQKGRKRPQSGRASKRFSFQESGNDSDNTSIATGSPRKGGFRPTSFLLMSDDEARYPMFMGGKVSLADELNLEEEDEEEEEEEEEEVEEEGEEADDENAMANGALQQLPDDDEDVHSEEDEDTEAPVGEVQGSNASVYEQDLPGDLIEDSGSEYEDNSGMLTPVPIDFMDADVQTSEPEFEKVPMIEEDEHLRAMDEKNIVIGTLQKKLKELEGKMEAREKEMQTMTPKEHALKLEESLKAAQAKVEEKEKALSEVQVLVDEQAKTLQSTKSTLEEKEKRLAKVEADLAAKMSPRSPIRSSFSSPEPTEEPSSSTRETEANQGRKRLSGAIFSLPPPPTPPAAPAKTFVSAGSQTTEVPPVKVEEPPKPITSDAAVQTDAEKKAPPPPIVPQIIPRINIIPPPPTPPPVPAAPREYTTASMQTDNVRYVSRTVQTAQIQIDHRKLGFSSAAAAAVSKAAKSQVNANSDDAPPPSLPRRSSKRNARRTSSQASIHSITPTTPTLSEAVSQSLSPFAAKGKEREATIPERRAPSPDKRKSNVSGMDMSTDDEFGQDAELSDGGYKTALSAPKPRKKAAPQMPLLPGQTEESVKALSRRDSNFRKTAMISSGTQAHSRNGRARSPSLGMNGAGSSALQIGPPFPVPARFSSRKNIYGNYARNESPTPMMGGGRPDVSRRMSGHARRPSLRKSRSAAALVRTSRARSPPPLSISSAAPDSPQLPPLPQDEVFSPVTDKYRFHWASKHRPQASTNTSNTGNASVASSVQQVSVVEAITQTMVGEWMWKYVRRRKSFGVPDSPGWETGNDAGGQRHRRWVWLAPYERAVMWSSRQPKDGAALLGKSGRKLPIQSVLDVKDDTPLPKNSAGMPREPGFNRSILILTPARALKFTAPTRERHYIWLTALSFLSHSNGGDDILSVPPTLPFLDEPQQTRFPPPQPIAPHTVAKSSFSRNPLPMPKHRRDDSDGAIPPPISRDPVQHGGGGGGGGGIRDSIRIAKGRFTVNTRGKTVDDIPPMPSQNLRGRESPSMFSTTDSIAEGPSIPRYPGHTRKRSNTGSRLPPRSISQGYSATSTFTGNSFVTDPFFSAQPGTGGIGFSSNTPSFTNPQYNLPSLPNVPNGGGASNWDNPALGTVRMEAFVETRSSRSRFMDDESEFRFQQRRRSGYSSRRDSYSYYGGGGGRGESVGRASFSTGTERGRDSEDFFRNEDPFRGF